METQSLAPYPIWRLNKELVFNYEARDNGTITEVECVKRRTQFILDCEKCTEELRCKTKLKSLTA